MARRRWNIETIKQVVSGEQPFVQVGYTGKEKTVKRKIGEEWTDSKGNTWRKTLDGKVKINKQMDAIRELIQPRCSVCGQRIDFSCDKLDHKIFPKTGKCFDCLQGEEMILRATGKWDDYEQLKMLKNKRGMLEDFRDKVTEAVEYLKNDTGKIGEVMSNGEVITWTGKSNPQWLEDAERDLIKAKEELVKVNEEITKFESILKK